MHEPALERTSHFTKNSLLSVSRGLVGLALFACGAPASRTTSDDPEGDLAQNRAAQAASPGTFPVLTRCPLASLILANPTVHCGDVTINGQAGANLYAGVRTIIGNLTITAGSKKLTTVQSVDYYETGVSFSMPDLQRVTGTLTIDTDRAETVTFSKLSRIDGGLNLTTRYFVAASSLTATARTMTSALSTPALVEVDGNIALTGDAGPVSG